MADEPSQLQDRATKLFADLENERRRYLRNARSDYYMVQGMSWGSAAFGAAAAVLGVVPFAWVEKWEVGLLAAVSTALIAISRQLGLQQKSNWHYRKTERLKALQRRLAYELPLSPSADNLAAISRAWSALDADMTKEWEDMQHEATTKPRQTATELTVSQNS